MLLQGNSSPKVLYSRAADRCASALEVLLLAIPLILIQRDAAIIEKGIRNGWSDVFALEGERFLASFAIPGVRAGQRNTSEKEFTAALEHKCVVADTDSLEARQIKAMVEGMKDEARRYIAAGGSIVEYGKRLTERQDAEIAIYNRVKADLDKARKSMTEAEFMTYWEKRNDELRNLGIKTVGLSDD